jgi:ubiquinone/menaquinone biosynthesis C-methylase UbiE
MAFEDQNKEVIELSDARKIELVGASYLEDFDLNWESLVGKKVLDIGGNDGSFAAAACSHGIDAVTVDAYPHLFAKEGISDKAGYVGGDVYHLPFKDESFDFVCARYLTPGSSRADLDDHIRDYLQEVMRVVKSGGEFRVLPAPFWDSKEGKEIPIERLRKIGYKVAISEGSGMNKYYIFYK